mmetsp:Transcript_127940/g.368606  ORF Transcript_127940/g.368606 Transcript_127940/m.368606 type:complete len:213 (+) Transcript_127940:62-700(+)
MQGKHDSHRPEDVGRPQRLPLTNLDIIDMTSPMFSAMHFATLIGLGTAFITQSMKPCFPPLEAEFEAVSLNKDISCRECAGDSLSPRTPCNEPKSVRACVTTPAPITPSPAAARRRAAGAEKSTSSCGCQPSKPGSSWSMSTATCLLGNISSASSLSAPALEPILSDKRRWTSPRSGLSATTALMSRVRLTMRGSPNLRNTWRAESFCSALS